MMDAFDEMQQRVLSALLNHSRTSLGFVDTSSAAEKAHLVNPPSPHMSDTRIMAYRNLRSGILYLTSYRTAPPLTSQDWERALAETNRRFTAGFITTDTTIYRTYDSPRLPYVKQANLDAYRSQFFSALSRHDTLLLRRPRLARSSITLAAFAAWGVDLCGHLYADGCGRTGLTLLCTLLARHGVPVPQFPSRDAYYHGAYRADGAISFKTWCRTMGGWVRQADACPAVRPTPSV